MSRPLIDQRVVRARLLRVLGPRRTKGTFMAAILLAVLGFSAAVQVSATSAAGLETLSQADLVRILDDVQTRNNRLSLERRELERLEGQLTSGTGAAIAAANAARERATDLAVLAGSIGAQGPGIDLFINDPNGSVNSQILVDAIQELRDAGAEAIEIESRVKTSKVRVIASTSFIDSNEGVSVSGQLLKFPLHIRAIGNASTLAGALDIAGGSLEQIRSAGASAVVTQVEILQIRSIATQIPREYARPTTAP
jgi:uncharacterized protein YlxW (UPF0749 family)